MTKPADHQLVERLLQGDEEAFTSLVERYHHQLHRLAHFFVSSEAVAQEVVQETWLAVLEGLARFEGRSSLKTWIFRILSNRAKTRGTREGRSIPFSALGDAQEDPAVVPERFDDKGMWAQPPQSIPEQAALEGEVRELIERAVAQLPKNQAIVVTLRDIQGWSAQETCNLLDISETNQRVLLHRARSKLRQVLESYHRGE